MDVKPVSFKFKGGRDYVQGPDLFNEMMKVFADKKLSNIRFTAHDFIRVPKGLLYSTISKEELSEIRNPETRCELNVEGVRCWLVLVSTPALSADVITREDYSEGKVISQCKVAQERIVLNGHSPYTFIETIVSMNKCLLQNMFPDKPGKWIFTRVDLVKFSAATAGLSLEFKHNMNFRLTKSTIMVDGEKVGDLYFSLVQS